MEKINLLSSELTMSSREIAQITGKQHSYVLKYIRRFLYGETLNNLSIIYNCPAKVHKRTWMDSSGRKSKEFIISYAVSAELFLQFGSCKERINLIRKSDCLTDISSYVNSLRSGRFKYKGKRIDKMESKFYEEYLLKIFEEKEILKGHQVIGGKYQIDFFIPKENLAIEIDEKHYKSDSFKAKAKARQAEIEKELGCYFISVSEDDYKKMGL